MIPDLQRIQIKIAADSPSGLNLDAFIEIFGRWRKEKHAADWVDLADYAHLPRGPGIVLVGHRCSIAFDLADPWPGILYTARSGLTGPHVERLTAAFEWCFNLANRLTAEPEFPKDVLLRTGSLELRFNDRLETPDTPETNAELRPAVVRVLNKLFGAGGYDLGRIKSSDNVYGFSIQAKKAELLDMLLGRISADRT